MRNLAKEVPVNVNELNRVAEAAGQLGIQRENILAFTETMAQLGVTTNLTAEEAATMLARFSNITGTAPEDVDRLGSALVGLGNNFATTEREIVEMALRLGGAGRISGLTAAEVFGLSAALSSVGIQAEAGGTAISQTLFEMNTAVLSGTENLEHFAAIAGVSAEEFAATFKAAPTEAVVQFVQGLRHIDDTGGDAAAALNTIGLDGARAARSIIALSGNVQGLRDAFARGNLEFEKNNALTEEAAKRHATAASKIQLAQNQLNDVAITIGGALLPPLVTLAAIVGKVVGVIGELLEANPRLTSALVIAGTAVGGLALALGGLLFVLPSLAAGFALLKGFVSRYTVTVTGATGATTAFGIASRVALGPIGLLVGALGLVAGGLAYAMRDTRTEAKKAREGLGDLDTVLFDMQEVGIKLSDVLEKRLNRALAETKQKLDDIEPAAEDVIKRLDQMTSVELEAFIKDLEKAKASATNPFSTDFDPSKLPQIRESIKLANDELRDTTASESFEASQKIAKAAIETLTAARDGDTISMEAQVEVLGTLVDAVQTGKEAKADLGETYEGVTAKGFKLVTVTDDITNSVKRLRQ